MSAIKERLAVQTNLTNWQLPVRSGALGGYYFDSGQAAGILDYAPVSLGAPVFTGTGFTWGTGFLTIDNRAGAGNYIKLPFKDPVISGSTSSDLSVCFVARANSAANNAFADGQHNPIFLSSYGGDPAGPYPQTKGVIISISAPGTLFWRDYEAVSSALQAVITTLTFPTSPASLFDNFQAVLCTRQTVAGVTTRTIRMLTAGLSASSQSTGTPISNVTTFLQIGGNPGNNSGGLFDITFMEPVSRAIATSEFYQAGSNPGRVQRRALVKTGVTI